MNQEQVLSIARTVLKIGGGYLIGRGVVDAAAWLDITGGVLAIVGIVWSAITHKKTA